MWYRDSGARGARYLFPVQSTVMLCMRYSIELVLNTQPVLVAIEM
jgi:hypothetical protein